MTLTSLFKAGPGGVMTDDVGVITGDLELRTTLTDKAVKVEVRYEGADEWYRLSASDCQLADPKDHEAVHHALLGVLNRPEG